MENGLIKVFRASAILTTLSAGVNLLSTLLIIKFFGPGVYADQIVDLAKISLMMIALEIIPSSYIVFKIQDKREWLVIFEAQLLVTGAIVIPSVYALVQTDAHFASSSILITAYTGLLVSKKYIDIVLQSEGSVHKLFALDCSESALRLALLAVSAWRNIEPALAVWFSLVVSTGIVQGIALYRVRLGITKNLRAQDRGSYWKEIRNEAPVIIKYYPSVVLKRISDTIVPIVADKVLSDKTLLAVFLLAFRGLNFVLVFGRIYEAILNHRASLSIHNKNGTRFLYLIAALSQASAIAISFVMFILSGLEMPSVTFLIILTANAWPAIFSAKDRAVRLSQYKSGRVAFSYLSYALSVFTIGTLANKIWPDNLEIFALGLFFASVVRYYVIRN